MLPTSLTRRFEWSVNFNIKSSYSGVGVGRVGTAACQVSWAWGFQCWQRIWRKKKESVRRNNGLGMEVDWNPTFPPELWLQSASLWLSTPPCGATLTPWLASPVEADQRFPKWGASLQPTQRLAPSAPSVRGAQLRQKMKILLRSLGVAVSPKHLKNDGHIWKYIYFYNIHVIIYSNFIFSFYFSANCLAGLEQLFPKYFTLQRRPGIIILTQSQVRNVAEMITALWFGDSLVYLWKLQVIY